MTRKTLIFAALAAAAAVVLSRRSRPVAPLALTSEERASLHDAPADAPNAGDSAAIGAVFAQYGAVIDKLGVKSGNSWYVSDDAVSRLKDAIAPIVGADPAKLQISTDPQTKAGRIGTCIVGTTGEDEDFVLSQAGKKAVIPAVVQKGVYVRDGEKVPAILYFDQDYKLLLGTDPCSGEIHRLRNISGTILDSSLTCPGGKTVVVGGDKNGLRLNGETIPNF
jgi:hypothetical protein